ncbi:c-type cytochrome [Sphingomonas sp. GlSt437]|uniref:c-type cytochrome n=1 Tax=Sphingomonas sp. GlSt437 TaxID=3389970 RepID=UPI003A85866D
MTSVRVRAHLALWVALAVSPSLAAAEAAGGAAADKALYEGKCGGCHSVEANRIGPLHRGVVGRRVASAPGYAYSAALRKVTGVWTPARLDKWLQNPQAFAPGTKMYLSVSDRAERAQIIAYLQSVSPPAAAHK